MRGPRGIFRMALVFGWMIPLGIIHGQTLGAAIPISVAVLRFSQAFGVPITVDPKCRHYRVAQHITRNLTKESAWINFAEMCGKYALRPVYTNRSGELRRCHLVPNKRSPTGYCPRLDTVVQVSHVPGFWFESLLDPVIEPNLGMPVLASRGQSEVYLEVYVASALGPLVTVIRSYDRLLGHMTHGLLRQPAPPPRRGRPAQVQSPSEGIQLITDPSLQ